MKQREKNFLIDEIIEMAWADDVSFETIRQEANLTESDVVKIMRRNLKQQSFRRWRQRVSGRSAKHAKRLNSPNRKCRCRSSVSQESW